LVFVGRLRHLDLHSFLEIPRAEGLLGLFETLAFLGEALLDEDLLDEDLLDDDTPIRAISLERRGISHTAVCLDCLQFT